MSTPDPYALLGVTREATQEQIRRAYEVGINRAHRLEATAHALALSRAWDTLSTPERRARFDRHGIRTDLRPERPPGMAPYQVLGPGPTHPRAWTPPAVPEPTVFAPPRRPARRHAERKWPTPIFTTLLVGITLGIAITVSVLSNTGATGQGKPTVPAEDVMCADGPFGHGGIHAQPATIPAYCTNGAKPVVLHP